MPRNSLARWISCPARKPARRTSTKRGAFRLEPFENRLTPTLFTVTGTGDTIAVDGIVTLREAMTAANLNFPSGDAPAGADGRIDIAEFGNFSVRFLTNLP